ncbi:phosphatase PAP2 family protein [Candidatus Sumerlaeota bacterium]|nr:phosphatase PAP2 family protein [Candidatus Sumerlaeota bacterium]
MESSSQENPEKVLPIAVRPSLILVGVALFVAALIEIQFSVPSWNFAYGLLRGPLDFLRSTIETANHFVAELTITVIVIVTWIHKPNFRHTIAPYLVALLLASTIVNVTKVVAGRARPHHGAQMNEDQLREVADYLKVHDNPILKPERGDYWMWFSKDRPGIEFLGWFTGTQEPLKRSRVMTTGDYSSFPSGHAASALLLALYLSILYPRARYLWYVIAVFTAMFRMESKMHYLGDVLAGGSIGLLTGLWVFSRPWAARFGHFIQSRVERIPGLNK